MRLPIIIALVLAAGTVAADTDEGGVTQIKQSFLPNTLETAVGSTVVFTNSDDVNHNLYTVAPDGKKTDYGVDKPGETTKIVFPQAGIYSVMCMIHPRMKMKITVK